MKESLGQAVPKGGSLLGLSWPLRFNGNTGLVKANTHMHWQTSENNVIFISRNKWFRVPSVKSDVRKVFSMGLTCVCVLAGWDEGTHECNKSYRAMTPGQMVDVGWQIIGVTGFLSSLGSNWILVSWQFSTSSMCPPLFAVAEWSWSRETMNTANLWKQMSACECGWTKTRA